MRKLIFAINITPDGFCDHRAVLADAEHHQFANDLLQESDLVLFGSNTYQLFENYWPIAAKKLSGPKTEREFARLITDVDKIVFSTTMLSTIWRNTTILESINKNEILELKQREGKDILIFGSPRVASQLMALGLIDRCYYSMQPIIWGEGKRFPEFYDVLKQQHLKFISSRIFKSGVITLCYELQPQ